ncbi:peptidoglycan DD-metalloendopeptidase family protein [Cohnella candidum]|uniref:G5 domain-containing protein n=1 Tax=Cohnella candidum TaxID=2674991 RepID=A0A3G3K456_9BACL|nr:peptidoglycan DD-metalloendopeptidase family protein [Cohnella candidum]AYQ74539.1 hypothetical protein EAV92_19375 [Cohnella candidum]
MADFRGTGRIRSAAAAVRGSLRHVRSYCLKGITVVNKKMLPKWSRFVGHYRSPIAATAIAVLGVGAVAIGGHQYVKAHMVDYYRVYVKGVPVGTISSSAKVEHWLSAKEAELDRADTSLLQALDGNQVTYRLERAYKARPGDEQTLAALAGKVTTHPIGVEVRIEGKTVGIVRDRATAEELLDKIKHQYVPKDAKLAFAEAEAEDSAAAAQQPRVRTMALSATVGAKKPATTAQTPKTPEHLVTSVDFVEKVDLQEVALGDGTLTDPDLLYERLTEDRPSPMLNVQSVEQVTQDEVIEATIEYKKSDDIRAGQSKMIRQGRDGKKRVTYRLVKTNGDLAEEEIVSEQILEKPVSTIILKGTKVIPGEGSGKFIWPVIGHRITSYLGERWGRMHNGIDMVGRSNIMAADDGVVEYAGYKSGGLGNMVIIDHKNGFKTVYGHMRSIKVKKGQIVEQGETIGIMGSTGHSTGTHLHFEIHLDGKLKNPTSYL